jgi:hypothetical protein
MGYDTTFTSENKSLLINCGLSNKKLINKSNEGVRQKISWVQAAKNLFGCTEYYRLADYYVEGENSDNIVKVFIAETCGKPPSSINTSGHSMKGGRLHFGYIFGDDEKQTKSIFFVIHPNSWGPYQSRFRTTAMLKFLKNSTTQLGGMAASAATGAFIGSVFPGVGTAVGAGVGAGVGWVITNVTPAYVGDYLRYIG